MRKITLEVKFDEKYVHLLKILHFIQVSVCRIGKVSGCDPEDIGLSPACVI